MLFKCWRFVCKMSDDLLQKEESVVFHSEKNCRASLCLRWDQIFSIWFKPGFWPGQNSKNHYILGLAHFLAQECRIWTLCNTTQGKTSAEEQKTKKIHQRENTIYVTWWNKRCCLWEIHRFLRCVPYVPFYTHHCWLINTWLVMHA